MHVISKNLNINSLSRYGCRNIFLKGFSDRDSCFNYIKSLKKMDIFLKQEYFKNLSEIDFSFIFIEDFLKVRLKISIGEQNVVIDPNIIAISKIQPEKLSKDQIKARVNKLRAQKFISKFPGYFLIFDVDVSDDFPDEEFSKTNFKNFIVDSKKKSLQYINKFIGD
jgi:hypothetical protein